MTPLRALLAKPARLLVLGLALLAAPSLAEAQLMGPLGYAGRAYGPGLGYGGYGRYGVGYGGYGLGFPGYGYNSYSSFSSVRVGGLGLGGIGYGYPGYGPGYGYRGYGLGYGGLGGYGYPGFGYGGLGRYGYGYPGFGYGRGFGLSINIGGFGRRGWGW